MRGSIPAPKLVNAVQHGPGCVAWIPRLRLEGEKIPSAVNCAYGVMPHRPAETPGNVANCTRRSSPEHACWRCACPRGRDVNECSNFLLMAKTPEESIYVDVIDDPAGARSYVAVIGSTQAYSVQMHRPRCIQMPYQKIAHMRA